MEVHVLAPRARSSWVAQQAVLVGVAVLTYFLIRHLTRGSRAAALAHARDVLELEKRLGIAVEADLQRALVSSGTARTIANWVYIWGHWPVIVVTMVWLARRHHRQFVVLRDAMLVSGAVGMVAFATFPVAPPRLADPWMVDTVTEQSHAYRVLQPAMLTNQYAAMPSLHVGWNLLVGMAILSAARTAWARVVGTLMPLLMATAVVVTANHYVLDAVVGVALVLLAHYLVVHLRGPDHRVAAPQGP